MPLNDPTKPQTAANKPRIQALINGKPMAGLVSATVTTNNHYQADRFTARVAIFKDATLTPAWWSGKDASPDASGVIPATPDVQIEFQVGWIQPGKSTVEWQPSFFIGAVDTVSIDLERGELELTGRDFTSRLIETKTQETYANQTASEIVQTIAKEHNMTADVTPTTTPVGQYYQLEHDRTTLNNFSRQTTEWDLLVNLAQEEGFDIWVDGMTIHFHPAQQPDTANPWLVLWQWCPIGDDPSAPVSQFHPPRCNVSDLKLDRSLWLAKGIQVTVKTWDSKHKAAFPVVVKSGGTSSPHASKTPSQNYVIVRPGLTHDQALKIGQQYLEAISQHERKASFRMPGDMTLTARTIVRIDGTETSFDQTYFVDQIDRTISIDRGFEQHVQLKNHSPFSETTVS